MFGDRERIALQFAASMTRNSNVIGDGDFAALKAQFDDGEIVEIAAVAGLFNYFNRFNNALRVPVTK